MSAAPYTAISKVVVRLSEPCRVEVFFLKTKTGIERERMGLPISFKATATAGRSAR